MTDLPRPEQQLAFLRKLQRLFSEGDFTATYKYALLISLADLAVESERVDGGAMTLPYLAIAKKFVALYWVHATPYAKPGLDAVPMVLFQNHGAQAAVITRIAQFRHENQATTLPAAMRHLAFPMLVRDVANTVSKQPAQYLQNMGGSADPFIYRRIPGGVELNPGVTYCLRQFQPLIQHIARQHWVDHIKRNRLNQPALGDESDLAAFLFESSRQTLAVVKDGLKKISNGHCFYCGGLVHGSAEVDHFVPFSVYPRDLMHNFVYAHGTCNRSKSDTLAALSHLKRWINYIQAEDTNLLSVGSAAGIASDLVVSRSVARWCYESGMQSEGRAWDKSRVFELINDDYLQMLK